MPVTACHADSCHAGDVSGNAGDVSGKRCRPDSFLARLESLQEQGDADAIVKGMLKHSGHVQVQQKGCRLLATLARDDDNKIKIAEAGGIEAILAALVAHTDAVGWGGARMPAP